MNTDLTNKVALITGGGSGIGEAACIALAQAGAAVAVVDYREPAAQAVAASIVASGGKAIAIWADVTDEEAVHAAVSRTVETLGGLHIVFANAGINGMQTPIEEMTLDEWNATFDTNMVGTFLTVKRSIPHPAPPGAARSSSPPRSTATNSSRSPATRPIPRRRQRRTPSPRWPPSNWRAGTSASTPCSPARSRPTSESGPIAATWKPSPTTCNSPRTSAARRTLGGSQRSWRSRPLPRLRRQPLHDRRGTPDRRRLHPPARLSS